MNLIEHVPCSDGQSHTSFGIGVNVSDSECLVTFFVFDNFRLADTAWRQEFTNLLSDKIQKDVPGKPVTFQFN
jgi:hypothetical protein